MDWTDFVPGYSAYKLLTRPLDGEKISDYASCAPSAGDCEADAATAKLQCWKCIRAKMFNALQKILPLAGIALVKGAAGIVLKELAKSLAKAAAAQGGKSLGAAFLGPIGVGIAILSTADVLVAIYKALDIINAGFAADKEYCKCEET